MKKPKSVPKCDHWIQYKMGPIQISVECQREADHLGNHRITLSVMDGFKWVKGRGVLAWSSDKHVVNVKLD